MSGQNDKNSKGLLATQPITLHWVREKRKGSNQQRPLKKTTAIEGIKNHTYELSPPH